MNLILLAVLGMVVVFTLICAVAMFTEMGTKKKSGTMKGSAHNQPKKRKS